VEMQRNAGNGRDVPVPARPQQPDMEVQMDNPLAARETTDTASDPGVASYCK
jgi:hypothetical protein